MLIQLLSGDLPRSRALTAILIATLLGLLCAPFLFSGARPLNTAATICVYIVLVASYDLLLGYTGIVSFAHTMFYGIGAYGVGIALASVDEPTWGAIVMGLVAALAYGAAGVAMGTRFLLTQESTVPDAVKRFYLDKSVTDTVVTRKVGLIRRRGRSLSPAAQQLYDLFGEVKARKATRRKD